MEAQKYKCVMQQEPIKAAAAALPISATSRYFRGSRGTWLLALALLAALLLVYHPAWHGKPVWDDDMHITRSELRSMAGLLRIWTEPGATLQYYPLTHSTFWLAHNIWGDNPAGYHILNIVLHWLSALILAAILRQFGLGTCAWLGAWLFALHPVMVESVAWISELKNTLSGVLYLAATLAYLKFEGELKKYWYVISMGIFLLALLAKTITATLPVCLLIVFWCRRGKVEWKRDILPLAPFVLLGAGAGLFTAWVERTIIGAEGSDYAFSFFERCLIAGRALCFYLGKLVWPHNLMFTYPRWVIDASDWQYYLALGVPLLCAALLWMLRKRWRVPLAAYLFFGVTLFPALGFFNVYPFRYSFVADHFQYLAAIGPLVLFAAAVNRMSESSGTIARCLLAALSVEILLVLGLLTWHQSSIYTDPETLYRDTLSKNPGCWMAHNNLGVILTHTRRLDEALMHYAQALECDPAKSETYNNLGVALEQLNRLEDAAGAYSEAFRVRPGNALAHSNLGRIYFKGGQAGAAIREQREAIRLQPRLAEAHYNLASTLMANMAGLDEAAFELRQVIGIKRDFPNAHYLLGSVLAAQGKLEEAAAQYREAAQLQPEMARVLENLAAGLDRQRQVKGR